MFWVGFDSLMIVVGTAGLIGCEDTKSNQQAVTQPPAIVATDVPSCMTFDDCAMATNRPACAEWNNGDNQPVCYGADEPTNTIGQCVYRAMDDMACVCVERDVRDCIMDVTGRQGVQVCVRVDDAGAGTLWGDCSEQP